MILYCDCDNTLIIWHDPPNHIPEGTTVWKGDHYTVNTELVDLVEKWHNKNLGLIVVWSGGGIDYADMWKRRILNHLSGILVLDKNLTYPTKDDIIVDDMNIKVNGLLIDPKALDRLREIVG